MKVPFLIVVIFLFARPVFSQDAASITCDSIIRVNVDSVRGLYSVSAKETIVVTNGKQVVEFVFLLVDKTVVMNITLKGNVYCLDESCKVNVKLKDGSDFDMPNLGKFNCDGEFSLFFGGGSGRKRELGLMQTNPMQYIKVGTRKSVIEKNRQNFVEVNIPPDKAIKIMQILDCISQY
jgi:hypothetical protein